MRHKGNIDVFSRKVMCSVQFRSVAELSPTLCDPRDCSPPGSSVHGIFQARVLEWGAIAFSVLVNRCRYIFSKWTQVGNGCADWFPSGIPGKEANNSVYLH